MPLTAGTRIGSYEIVCAIGSGGMGEVYRAHDTNLDRDVAIKILPELFASDPDRLARFKREAKTLAALNHPHIAQIHGEVELPPDRLRQGSGESAGALRAKAEGGSHAVGLVMEFVDGEDLAARIARGPIPVAEALHIARQIADALDAAHERGIVHRDLKPANIKIADDGTVKLLDFGLAKALQSDSSADAMNSPTILASGPQATAHGVILGTAAYMSPEQARGRTVDKRADIWAFGVVLYEMLTGRSPFKGGTVTDALAAIVTSDPDWTALPGGTPERVIEVMRRCLEKDTKQRLRDIGDARAELSGPVLGATTDRSGSSPAARRYVPSWIWIGAIVLALLIGAAIGSRLRREPSASPAPISFEITVPDRPAPVISPDGSRIAFTSRGRLFVRELGSVSATELSGTEGAVSPFWSHDSSSIGYGANGKLWRISPAGGTPFLICNLPQGQWDSDAGGAWLPDGYITFTNGGSPLYRVAAIGSDPAIVVKPPEGVAAHYHDATPLPDGRGVLFVTHGVGGSDTLELWTGSRQQQLLQLKGQAIHDPVYSPTGHILFHRQPGNAGLWGIPFSLERLSVTGEPFLVVPGVGSPSISRSSSLVYVPDVEAPPSRLVWLNREGKVLSRIEPPRIMDPTPALSPDGTRAAVSVRTDDKWDIWVIMLSTGAGTRVTSEGTARRPRWSPDGKSIVYDSAAPSNPPGTGQAAGTMMKRASADGSGGLGEFGAGRDAAMSHDAQRVIFVRDFDIFSRSISGGQETGLVVGPTTDGFPAPSPDGRYLAFMTMTPTNVGVSVAPMSAPQNKLGVGTETSWWPRWSRDGRRLFFATTKDIQEVDIHSEPAFRLGIPKPVFARTDPASGAPAPFDVSGDGERFLFIEPDKSVSRPRSMVVVLNFAPNAAAGSR